MFILEVITVFSSSSVKVCVGWCAGGPGMSTLARGPGNGRALHWSGVLPARADDAAAELSSKLFLGGLPWDITESALMHALRHFHPMR